MDRRVIVLAVVASIVVLAAVQAAAISAKPRRVRLSNSVSLETSNACAVKLQKKRGKGPCSWNGQQGKCINRHTCTRRLKGTATRDKKYLRNGASGCRRFSKHVLCCTCGGASPAPNPDKSDKPNKEKRTTTPSSTSPPLDKHKPAKSSPDNVPNTGAKPSSLPELKGDWVAPQCTKPRKRRDFPERKAKGKTAKLDCKAQGLTIDFRYFNRFPNPKQYGRIRANDKIDTVVIHEGASATRLVKSKRWKEKSISTHFVVERDGTVFQMMDLVHSGHHTGGKLRMNRRSVGIDLQTSKKGRPCSQCSQSGGSNPRHCQYTSTLIHATGKLIKCLLAKYPKIKKDDAHIVGHREYGKHGDPRNFPWSSLGLGLSAANKKARGWSKKYGPVKGNSDY